MLLSTATNSFISKSTSPSMLPATSTIARKRSASDCAHADGTSTRHMRTCMAVCRSYASTNRMTLPWIFWTTSTSTNQLGLPSCELGLLLDTVRCNDCAALACSCVPSQDLGAGLECWTKWIRRSGTATP
ncbi:hypothetical protein BCR44DRAFT_1177817 [Catenaria anguillulae PL171]|uniref:Uncharacterized protein n=1 Tax=Catenaria anguillulae PL171 TaxID=765915 RepID=A0A1Y2HK06_9FUNG|nr:hypothetical protein BCR44DRAFT_1177817 [Catenaria anguillulae PL171]